MGDSDIHPTILIKIKDRYSTGCGQTLVIERNLFEGSFPLVRKDRRCGSITSHHQINSPVVVDVGEHRTSGLLGTAKTG